MKGILGSLWKRGGAAPAAAGPLTPEGLLASDLWVDRPDAAGRLAAWEGKGEVAPAAAAALRRFVADGYLTFDAGLPPALFDEIQADVDRAWREKPPDLAWTREGPLRSFADADPARDRGPSYRIADLHSHSRSARALYLWKPIFEYVERILGQPAVATQSLYFEYGSQQPLHRDPVFVQTKPPSALVAAWIALEDIHPESGPLVYVPGSHRLPVLPALTRRAPLRPPPPRRRRVGGDGRLRPRAGGAGGPADRGPHLPARRGPPLAPLAPSRRLGGGGP